MTWHTEGKLGFVFCSKPLLRVWVLRQSILCTEYSLAHGSDDGNGVGNNNDGGDGGGGNNDSMVAMMRW